MTTKSEIYAELKEIAFSLNIPVLKWNSKKEELEIELETIKEVQRIKLWFSLEESEVKNLYNNFNKLVEIREDNQVIKTIFLSQSFLSEINQDKNSYKSFYSQYNLEFPSFESRERYNKDIIEKKIEIDRRKKEDLITYTTETTNIPEKNKKILKIKEQEKININVDSSIKKKSQKTFTKQTKVKISCGTSHIYREKNINLEEHFNIKVPSEYAWNESLYPHQYISITKNGNIILEHIPLSGGKKPIATIGYISNIIEGEYLAWIGTNQVYADAIEYLNKQTQTTDTGYVLVDNKEEKIEIDNIDPNYQLDKKGIIKRAYVLYEGTTITKIKNEKGEIVPHEWRGIKKRHIGDLVSLKDVTLYEWELKEKFLQFHELLIKNLHSKVSSNGDKVGVFREVSNYIKKESKEIIATKVLENLGNKQKLKILQRAIAFIKKSSLKLESPMEDKINDVFGLSPKLWDGKKEINLESLNHQKERVQAYLCPNEGDKPHTKYSNLVGILVELYSLEEIQSLEYKKYQKIPPKKGKNTLLKD